MCEGLEVKGVTVKGLHRMSATTPTIYYHLTVPVVGFSLLAVYITLSSTQHQSYFGGELF